MLKDITSIQYIKDYVVQVTFEDGVSGALDLSKIIKFNGIFKDLQDPENFKKVELNKELGIITWPNGADLDSDVIYSLITSNKTNPLDTNQKVS